MLGLLDMSETVIIIKEKNTYNVIFVLLYLVFEFIFILVQSSNFCVCFSCFY